MFKENFAKLIKVKTIVTLLLTIVFCFLAITGAIVPELFMSIFTMIIGFYFGTQNEKKSDTSQE